MKTLNENQKDILNVVLPFALFWAVMMFFISTTPDYCQTNKAPQNVKKQTQSPVLEKYGELITKNK
jgi:hypothetical protein